jgi:hemerythrin superfamily protein
MASTAASSTSRAKAGAARRRQAATRAPNAITMLKQDHEAVAELAEKYERGKNRMSAERKQQMAQEICRMLTIHTTIEEELFYPAAREHVRGLEDMLDEAEIEHDAVKELIATVQNSSPDEELYDARIKVISEYVKHHVKEEQNQIFPKVRKSKLDLEDLGEQMQARRHELEAET